MINLRAGTTEYFYFGDRLVDVNQIIYDYQARCNGSDNHAVAQEVSKIRLAAHALWRGDEVEPSIVERALKRLGRGWMIE